MLQLADCSLECTKALQAYNFLWEGIPLYNCQRVKRILIVIPRGVDLPEGDGVTVSRDSTRKLHTCIVRERDSHKSVYDLVKLKKTSVGSPLIQCSPS